MNRTLTILFGILISRSLTGCDCDQWDAGSCKEIVPTMTKKSRVAPITTWSAAAGIGVAVADMDGDGILDIVTAQPEGVRFFRGNSEGLFPDQGFIAKLKTLSSEAGIGVAVADVDRNGIPDIIVTAPDGVQILKNPVLRKN